MSKIYKVKYLQPTNTKGARISITDITYDWDIKRTIIDWDYKYDNAVEIALVHLSTRLNEIYKFDFKDGDVSYLIFE